MALVSREIRTAVLLLAGILVVCGSSALNAQDLPASTESVEQGRLMYMDGLLPSGEMMTGFVSGDVMLTGQQVICGACHRRSGMGSSEGQDVVPAVTGDFLFNPLRLPTSKPPLAPELRPAYTDASLKRAIRDGIDADGKEFSPLMPRYPLSDQDLETLIAYLKGLDTGPDPGVTDSEIHFATVVTDSVDAATRKALIDVFESFFNQKNTETRHESHRAAKAPWHKKAVFGPYRKWVLHVWELNGPAASWPEQLEAQYRQQPVFAVLNGIAPGSWQPIHDFCERARVPCLFPTTDLPVIDERDFYSVYLSKGMTLEAEAIGRNLAADDALSRPVAQVFRKGDLAGETAANALRRSLERRRAPLQEIRLKPAAQSGDIAWPLAVEQGNFATVVLWLGATDLQEFWRHMDSGGGPEQIYLSPTLYDPKSNVVPATVRNRVYFAHPYELPTKLPRLLARSTGWLRAKRIYAPEHKRVQANAFFALKMVGGAVAKLHGYYLRDYLLERIEHMVDNASYTSVYPRISLAPAQRFVAKGSYIAKFAEGQGDRLVPVTGWIVP